MPTPLSANDINIAIDILADTRQAVTNINTATNAVNQYITAVERANSVSKASGGMIPPVPQADVDKVKKFGEALGQIDGHAKKASNGLWSLRNVARTALGTFEAMSIFLISQFIGQAIKKSIESVKQLELAVYNLVVAEKALSKAGIEITPQDFREIEQAVKDTGIAISKIDIKRLVANTAAGTVDLKLSVEQLKNLSIAVAAIAYANNKSVEEVQNTIQTSLTTSGRGLKPLDIPVDALIIKEKAVEAQLVKNKEAYDALTGAEKQRIETAALLLIIDDKANQLLAEQDVLAGGLTDTTRELSVSWEDFTTVMGQIFAPTMILVLGGFLDWLKQVETALGKSQATIEDWAASVASAFAFTQALLSGQNWATAILKGMEAFKKAKEYTDNLNRQTDTPTAPGGIGAGVEEDTGLQDALDKFNKEILEAQLKLEQDLIDADIDLMRKLEDIDTEYLRKRSELWIDYSEKIGDINQDYNDKIKDIEEKENDRKQKARNDALDKERKFQNSMLELREDFLMSLEDALHARDARQILKLISQYNLDKLQAERKHALDMQSDKQDEILAQKKAKREAEQAKEDRKRKIAEAKEDYEQKLAQLKRDEAAERAAARLADRRKREDLRRAMQDRLEQVAAGLVSEYNLTARGLTALANLYLRYYRNVGQVYAAMRAMMSGMGGAAPIQTTPNYGGSMGTGLATGRVGANFAEGGTMIANRPTTVTFGEGGGLEMAQFTPLNGRGKDVNKIFSSMGGSGGGAMGGSVSIELLLSPDLEARVVQNSLNKTAEIITRVQRSK